MMAATTSHACISDPVAFGGRRTGAVQVLERTLKVKLTSQTQDKPNLTFNYVRRVDSDFGAGFLLWKVGLPEEDAYQILLAEEGPHCTCWDAAGGEACRHILALQALVAAGLI